MLPILYKSNETNFTHNGIGILRDAITAVATEELNGMFELQIEYDSLGEFAHVIDEEMIIKAKANDKQDPQLFRIYSIEKNHDNDNLIIDAQHITYDLANNFVEKLEARNITKQQVMELIGASTANPHPFNVTSSNNTTRSTTNLYRTNPLQMIGGMDGSVLQIWGGQLERDNYHLIMHDRRGKDDGVKIQYAKNLTGLTAKVDISNVVTRIYPFAYHDEDDRLITITGKYIDSEHIDDYDIIRVLPVDYSQEEEIDWEQTDAQIRSKLTQLASRYFVETGNDKPKTEIDVEFEHLWETKEYKDLDVLELVGMGDTVHIHHSKLNVTATAIVNRIEYDVLADINIRVGIGNVKSRLSDSLNRIDRVEFKVEQAESNANQAIISANGKNKNYYGPDMPTNNLNEGDTWFQLIDGQYTRTWRYDGIQWHLIIDMDVNDAYEQAQEAKEDAQQAVDRANQATANANQAISNAQSAFDQAQSAINQSTSAFNLANQAFEDVAALSTMVDTNSGEISTIKQSVQGLQISVSDAAGNASNALQIATGLQNTVSNVEGQVSTLQQTATNISSRIDNLQIGGRNLLRNSNFVERNSFWSTWSLGQTLTREIIEDPIYSNIIKIETTSANNYMTNKFSNYTGAILKKGDELTVTFTVKGNSDIRGIALGQTGNGAVYLSNSEMIRDVSDEWQELSVILKMTEDGLDYTDWGLRFTVDTGIIYIARIMLSKGNKVIDWSPAPEDTDQKFSAINQTIDNIATRVQTNENNYSSITQTVDGIQLEVNKKVATTTYNTKMTQLDNAIQARLTTEDANNKFATINELTLTSESLQSTISNMQIGGRNLITLDSVSLSASQISDGYRFRLNKTNSVTGNPFIRIPHTLFEPVTEYVISFKVRKISGNVTRMGGHIGTIANAASTKIYRDGELITENTSWSDPPPNSYPNDTKTYKYTIYFRTNSILDGDAANYWYIQPNRNNYGDNFHIEIWDWQLEQGNKATDWSPAPEDTQSQITQLADNINLRVEKDDIINQINVSTESILISGRKVHITGQTTIDNASIDGAKIKNASIGTAQIGVIDAAKISTGTLNASNVTVRGGSSTDYTLIQGALFESQGRYTRTWRNQTTTRTIKTQIHDGGINFINTQDNRALWYSDFGVSTFKDGDGEGTSSGTLAFFDTTHSVGGARGVTLVSNTGVVALETRTSAQDILLKSSGNVLVKAVGVLKVSQGSGDGYTESHLLMPRETTNLYAGFENEFRFTNRDFYNDGNTIYNRFRASVGFVNGLQVNEFGQGGTNLYLGTRTGEVQAIRDSTNTNERTYAPMRMSGAYLDRIIPNETSKIVVESGLDVRGNLVLPSNEQIQTSAGYIVVRAGSGYVFLQSNNEVRTTQPGQTSNYIPLRSSIVYAQSKEVDLGGTGRLFNDSDGTFIQGAEIKATRYKSTTYVPVRASSFPTASLAEYKINIEKWNGSALEVIRNTTFYEYQLKSEFEAGKYRKRQGLVIGDRYNTPSEFIDGDGVEQYLMNTWSMRAIQELDSKSNTHEDRINTLELENQYLKQKIKQLEETS